MYIFIINPAAGHGRAKSVFTQLMKSEIYQRLNSKYFYTQYKGQAEEIIRTIINEYHPIKSVIVVGGDGTLHEVVNAMSPYHIPISFIPGGSGNDFARECSINGHPVEILQSIIQETTPKSYWLGKYTTDQDSRNIL